MESKKKKKKKNAGLYWLDANDQTRLRALQPIERVISVWPKPPLNDHLHVFVSLPSVVAVGSLSILCVWFFSP
jgi:hypothetical protein